MKIKLIIPLFNGRYFLYIFLKAIDFSLQMVYYIGVGGTFGLKNSAFQSCIGSNGAF